MNILGPEDGLLAGIFQLLAIVLVVCAILSLIACYAPLAPLVRLWTRRVLFAVMGVSAIPMLVIAPEAFRYYRWRMEEPLRNQVKHLISAEKFGRYTFQTGSVLRLSHGEVFSAEVSQTHNLEGMLLTGDLQLRNGKVYGGISAADQTIDGVPCAAGDLIEVGPDGRLVQCKLAKPHRFAGVEWPAGTTVHSVHETTASFNPPDGAEVVVNDFAVPPGFRVVMDTSSGRIARLESKSMNPARRAWIELRGLRLSGVIYFNSDGTVNGELWQDTLVNNVPRKLGERVTVHK